MNNDKAEVDVIRRVFPPNHSGEFVEVGPWAEVPGFVHLRTTDEKCKEYFGELNLSMAPEFARALALALLSAAEETEEAAK